MSSAIKFLKFLPTVLIAALIGGLWYGWHVFAEHHLNPAMTEDESQVEAERTEVTLGPEKLAATKIKVEAVVTERVQKKVQVPGRLSYDETQHVAVRTAAAGWMTKINVMPGDKVEQGHVLAVMSSPEVGSARADEMQNASEMELAQRQNTWDTQRAQGIRKMVQAIREGKSIKDIRESFVDEKLGAARETLLTAYSQQMFAKSSVTRIEDAAGNGALAGRTLDERRRDFEASGASLQATMEQTLFDADRAQQASKIKWEDAQRRWQIAKRRVETLLGDFTSPVAIPSSPSSIPESTDLALIEVRAPRSGTIEKKLLNANERADAGDELFVLADTSRLWLKADVRESQWNALAIKPGQQITAVSPAMPDEELVGTVVMMGREVDAQTNAIALVASVDNAYGRLRPGLFMRVELPLGEVTTKLVIPESALTTHDNENFVFVTTDEKTFVRRDVRIGAREGDRIEIIAGLQEGERIATSEVFTLKSELLLEAEE